MPAQPAMNLADTIVAVSSPAGAAERAIVRLSGDEAVAIADRVFDPSAGRHGHPPLGGHDESASGHGHAGVAMPPTCIAELPTYSACDGRIALPADHMDVPATVYLMRGPRSYTREDVVELHVGGWPAVVPLVVEALVSAGARPAEPGEFTFRALVHGRLDLAQAEAVMAVIDAGSRAALRAAGDLLAGDLSREVAALAARVREALALVEVDLDFSDQDVPPIPPERIAADLAAVRDDLAALGRRSRAMETFSGEARLVLAGWPNAGKSSLFNRLLARDRAIVTDVPGTTRDEVRATLHRGGLALRLSDVAGLDVARDELAGLARAKAEALARAGVDVLSLGDDVGMPRSMILGPEHWREFLGPRMASIIAAGRAIKPDVRVVYHSDGWYEPIVGDLIDIGVNAINPVQPEHMDAAHIRRRFGTRIAFWGTVGHQTTFAHGTPEDIRREVRERIATLGRAGLVLCPAYDVPWPEVPWANIAAFLEAADVYGGSSSATP